MDKNTVRQEKIETKRKIKELKYYYRKKIYHIAIVLTVLVILVALLMPWFFEFLKQIFYDARYSEWLGDSVWVCFVQILSVVLLLIITGALIYSIKRVIIPNRGKQRDARQVISSLESEDVRSPAVRKEALIERIVGHDATDEIKTEVGEIIQNNIEYIKEFIINNEKALVVNGKWGTGKTTYTLVALDEICNDDKFKSTDYRFIYESAFKYVSELGEFKKDILKVMRSILSEQNIFGPFTFSELINNLSTKKYGIALPELGSSKTTTDIINRLNKKYRKRKNKRNDDPFRIIIIIDDIDRLQGEEIIQTLALLSAVRRLEFVKIILPIDRDVVIKQLAESKITDPQMYINKYLPEQVSIKICSSFDLITDIFLKKIRKEVGPSYSDDKIRPILECFYIKAFSNRLRQNMEDLFVSNLGEWPKSKNGLPEELFMKDSNNSDYIFEARNYLIDRLDQQDRAKLSYIGCEGNFESIIYLMKFSDKRPYNHGAFPLRVDDELYEKCIKSWVMDFARHKWERLNLSIREMDDMYNQNIKQIKSVMNEDLLPHNIFVKAYNIVLPERPITDEMLTGEKLK